MIDIRWFPGEIFRGETVAEKAVHDTRNKQRDYIVFMEQILDVCLDFKKKIDSGYSKIFFREKGADHDWYGIQEEDWVNSLFSCVYDAIASKTKKLEISQSDDGDAEEYISLLKDIKDLEIETEQISKSEGSSSAEKKINEVLERLQGGFGDGEATDRLRKDCEKFFSVRRQLLTRKSVFHLKRAEIEEYLNEYYRLLLDLVLFYDVFDQEQDRNIVISELLRLDTVHDKKNNIYQMDFWSPIVLNKLQKVNGGIADFFKQIVRGNAAGSEWLQKIYKHIVRIKAQHDFRWYMPGAYQELLHAAIAPYVDNLPSKLNFQVIARSLKQYNSYEGIGELRLGEKIIYEYELIKDKINSRFTVAIMGDLHVEPIKELYNYVKKKIKKLGEDSSLEFNIFTKNNWKGFINPHITYQGCPEKVLLNKNELEQVIVTNNVLFILDCVELYKSPVPQKETHEFVKNRFVFNRYCDCNAGTERTDICNQNMLEGLYEIIACEQIFKQFGRISKQANDPLLEFCEKKQNEVGEKSTIYVYVSDMQAFDKIYHDDQYYIRTERYNQKEIGIIRYSSEKVTKLRVGTQKNKILVFNIWQFIKNVAMDERNMFLPNTNKSEYTYMDLDRIYIGIDYRDWRNLLEVHYFCEEEGFEKVALRFIKEILLPVLNNRNGDMFYQYIRKAMYSFFFSAAKSVNDMLFAHLFLNKERLLGKVVRAEKNDAKRVQDNRNINYKFSSKRFYDMIMKNYDMSSNMYVGQIRTSQIIQKNEQRENRINKDEIYQNVITACKNLSYEDTYLVKNCELELNRRY